MFKGRFWVWIVVILVCIGMKFLFSWVPTWFESYDVTVSSNISSDASFSEVAAKGKSGKFHINIREDAEYFFTDKEYDEDGYTKYENFISSPLVLYLSNNWVTYSNGLISIASNRSARKVDLYSILVAVENDAEWESLGLSTNVVNGPVILTIPNEQSEIYDDVIELFYLALNGGNEVTEEVKEDLEPRVVSILKKCEKVPNIGQAIEDECKNRTKTNKAFIGPEYYYVRGDADYFSNYVSNAYLPVYFQKTVFLTADLYIKDENTSDVQKGDEVITFIDSLKQDSRFFERVGWRVKDINYDVCEKESKYLLREPN